MIWNGWVCFYPKILKIEFWLCQQWIRMRNKIPFCAIGITLIQWICGWDNDLLYIGGGCKQKGCKGSETNYNPIVVTSKNGFVVWDNDSWSKFSSRPKTRVVDFPQMFFFPGKSRLVKYYEPFGQNDAFSRFSCQCQSMKRTFATSLPDSCFKLRHRFQPI